MCQGMCAASSEGCEAGKGEYSPLKPLAGTQPCQTLDFSPASPTLDSYLTKL